MKNFNKNIIVFMSCIIFIGIGLCSKNLYLEIGNALQDFFTGNASITYRINKLENKINKIFDEETSYRYHMVTINSIKNNILGTKVIIKDNEKIVESDSGKLMLEKNKITDTEISFIVSNILKLKNIAESNNAKFLYCVAPTKELYEKAPANIQNYAQYNHSSFLYHLEQQHIPFIDLSQALTNCDINTSEIFYRTDHHWTTKSGFFTAKSICEELSLRYNFKYDIRYTDINNYNIRLYQNYFLGSRGKKVGLYFNGRGADDFELITPKFSTNITEEQPLKGITRTGSFEETMLYTENLNINYYEVDPYSTYCGGIFRLQIMRNNLNSSGKKILLICDSFAGVVAPFLMLNTSELHTCDMRDFSGRKEKKLNAEQYIKEINPDYVMVLYHSVSSIQESSGKYNFF